MNFVPLEDFSFKIDPYAGRPDIKAVVSFRVGPLTVRGVRIIAGDGGKLLVKYPDKPKVRPCVCGSKIGITFLFCPDCGTKVGRQTPREDTKGRVFKYIEFVHPSGEQERREVERQVLGAYLSEVGVRPVEAGGVRLFVPSTVGA